MAQMKASTESRNVVIKVLTVTKKVRPLKNVILKRKSQYMVPCQGTVQSDSKTTSFVTAAMTA